MAQLAFEADLAQLGPTVLGHVKPVSMVVTLSSLVMPRS